MPKSLALIELTLASITACCDSLERHSRDIGEADAATLDRLYHEILEVQAHVVWGRPPSTPEAPPLVRTAEDERRDTLAALSEEIGKHEVAAYDFSVTGRSEPAERCEAKAAVLRTVRAHFERGDHEGAAKR